MQRDHYKIAFWFLLLFCISLIQLVYIYNRITLSVNSQISQLQNELNRNEFEIQRLKHLVSGNMSYDSKVEEYIKSPMIQNALMKGSKALTIVYHTELVNSLKSASSGSFGGNWKYHPDASGKTTVIVLANFIWIDFLENLIVSLEHTNSTLLKSFLVVALDSSTVEWVKNYRFKLDLVDFSSKFSKQAHQDNTFMSQGFVQLCYLKAEVIISSLIHGINVLVFDLDISFKEDPLLFLAINSSDIAGACTEDERLEINYGMTWIKASDQMVGVFLEMYRRMEEAKELGDNVNDQIILDHVYKQNKWNVYSRCVDISLNGEKCLYDIKQRNQTAVLFHATCLTGRELKKNWLKQVNAWYLH